MTPVEHRAEQTCLQGHTFFWAPHQGACPYCDISQDLRIRSLMSKKKDYKAEPCPPGCCPSKEQLMNYREAVAEFRSLDENIETGQWRQAQLTWENASPVEGDGKNSLADWANRVGKNPKHIKCLYSLWDQWGNVAGPRPKFADAYRMMETSADTPEEASAIKDGNRAASSLSKLPPKSRASIIREHMAEPEVAEAATDVLTSTPQAAQKTYQAARKALIEQARDEGTLPPAGAPEPKQERILRIEQFCDDTIRLLAEVLDEDTDPTGQRLAFLEHNLDALSEQRRQRLARAVIELGARVSAWEDRVRGLSGHTVAD